MATEFRPQRHVLYQRVPGAGGVLLDLDRREYFALDDVAARMWEILSDAGRVADVAERLALEYEVDRTSLEEDVRQFVQVLADRNLVHPSNV